MYVIRSPCVSPVLKHYYYCTLTCYDPKVSICACLLLYVHCTCMRYCTVMYVLYVLHVVVLCVETVLLYATLCHHHGLPRIQVTHISTAKHACTPSEDILYPVVTRAHPTTRYTISSDQYLRDSVSVRQLCYKFFPYNLIWPLYIIYVYKCTYSVYDIMCLHLYIYLYHHYYRRVLHLYATMNLKQEYLEQDKY